MSLYQKLLRTGATANAPHEANGQAVPSRPQKDLFFPLEASVWSSPQVSYSYDGKEHGLHGVFTGTKGQTVYAPETGSIVPLQDGGFVIQVDDKDNAREWIGGFVLDIDKRFTWGEVVHAGQPLGTLATNLVLGLKVTPKGNGGGYKLVDPVDILQRGEANFVNLPSTAIIPAGANLPAPAQASPTGIDLKSNFTPLQMLAAGVGGTILGMLLIMAFKKR